MLIIVLVQQLGIVQMDERKYCFFFILNELIFIFLFSAAVPQRPQPQVSDRRQIDDMEANNARSNSTTSPATVARGTTANVSTDELGPLPPGWQMSRTDSDRLFFIDHINKRTTWVKTKKIIKNFLLF